MVQSSYSLFQVQAFKEAMSISEPGDKMDESIFLQHCARLQSKFNLVKTYRSGARLGAYVKPSQLSASQAKVELKCAVAIPPLASGELDWSSSTKRRLENDKDSRSGPTNSLYHGGFTCDGCGKSEQKFTGTRYHCTTCDNYDLCQECFLAKKCTKSHQSEHPVQPIEPEDRDTARGDVSDVLAEALAETALNDMSPLQKERLVEEAQVKKALDEKTTIITHQQYEIDGDGDFIQVLKSGAAPSTRLIMCVQVKDINNLHWKEAQAIQTCLRLGERGSKGSPEEFKSWAKKIEESKKFGTVRLRDEPDKNRVVLCINFSGLTQNFSKGKTQRMSLSTDSDGDWRVSFDTDFEQFEIVVSHEMIQSSYSLFQVQAFKEAMSISEPGDKMDESIFLQHCARLQSKFNLVKTYRSGARLGAYVKPSQLSASQAKVELKCAVAIPPLTSGELDWSSSTKRRLELDNPAPVNSEARAAEALRILMAMAQTAADQKGGLTPFQEERKGEEQAIQVGQMAKQEVVCLMTYGFRDDGDFASILVSGREPDVKFCFIVSVEDKQNLSWKEAQAIRLVVKLGERGTKINTNDFKGWAPQLDNKYASARYSHTENQRLISINPGDARRSFPPGHVQHLAYIKKDADDDFVLAFQTDVKGYCVIISHVIQNGSFSKWQGKALVDVLEYFETGNKLDDTIFMQCCTRMNQGNNIVLVHRQDGILIAHIHPTTLTEQQARLNTRGQDLMTLPPVHDGKLDWDDATKDRLRAARGGSASEGSSPERPTLVDDSMPVYGDGMVIAHRLLKNSGQADVYSGIRKKNKGNEQRVAIKVYKQEQDWTDCKDEIIALLKISGHRNVMEVLDFYEKPKPCVVMRLVDGGDLRDYLDRNGGMEWKLANKVLSGIASGLHHLHEHKMVHRDLKSPNILLEMPSLEPVLIDMGLGQTMDNESKSLLETNGMKGTVVWMAPEMISDNKWNTKTDIYALGIIMWEIMTGKVPYIDQGLGIAQILLAVVSKQTRPTISAVAGKMEPTMVQLMERAWHQDHSQRPTAAEFLMAINRCSTDNYTAKG